MKNKGFHFIYLALILVLTACYKGKSVDLIVHNANIYTVDLNYSKAEAMAIKDGKIVEVGPERKILNKYAADETIDAGGKDVFPGFTDAHGHMLSLLEQKLNLDLVGCKSKQEMLFRTEKYGAKLKRKCLVGRGWDQSLWGEKELPTNEELNKLFPDVPVILYRVDGHAALVNDCMLKKAGITADTKVEGGKILANEGVPSGIILDNAINLLYPYIQPYTDSEKKQALLEIQEELFQSGITSVHEAGINFEDIALFESLYRNDQFKLNLYAMLYPTDQNIDFARKKGIYRYKNLLIRSFKVVGDGSLGSRGACLKQAYSDDPHNHGFLITSLQDFQRIAEVAREVGYQMNTHAIGDSTNKIVIDIITETYKYKKDHRWRIEHAQVLDLKDLARMAACGAFPSVQPTHAVSDQRWAEQRIGSERLKGAYAYQTILNHSGIIAFGTDFPVESFDPFLTIHAAVNRKNKNNQPLEGFLSSEAVSLKNCIQAMTFWPAFASFQENERGSLESGKTADFVIFERPVNASASFQENYAFATFIKGKKVYSAE